MSTFGPFPFRIGGPGNPPDGTLKLTYTSPVPPSLSINPASFTYTNVGQPQTYTVNFAAPVNGVYNGTSTMPGPPPPQQKSLTIPGSGVYTSGTFVFTPAATPPTLTPTLTGSFSGPGNKVQDINLADVAITWEADSSTGPAPKPTPAEVSGKY